MTTYTVKHIDTGQEYERPAVHINPHLKQLASAKTGQQPTDPATEAFHRQLPSYGETKLHSLPSIARELGLAHVFVKDESTRFGLPSFKILGASWAIHQAVCQCLGLPGSTSLSELRDALKASGSSASNVRLVTCTEGNWGRATARMAHYLGIPSTIYVPGFMRDATQNLLRGEGADVKVLIDGSYDDTIAAARRDADETGALLVMDTSWPGYEEIPRWVTDGYGTMLRETDRQVAEVTDGKMANVCICSVGVGSWAHSVISHYRGMGSTRIVTVEPTSAASFKESLHCDAITPIETGHTIMDGMNCGTTSTIAWPQLRDGTFAAVTVSDMESHACVQGFQEKGVNAGPCGAATLAALKKLCKERVLPEGEMEGMVVVLFSTEGRRDYEPPR